MNDLQTVSVGDLDLLPTLPGDDLTVEFHGDPVAFKCQGKDDGLQGCR